MPNHADFRAPGMETSTPSDPYARATRIGACVRTVDGRTIVIRTIDDELSRLGVADEPREIRRAKSALIRPEEPLFYLRFVALNDPIKLALKKIARDERLQAQVAALTAAIRAGAWDDPLLSHTGIRNRLPDQDPPIHIKDIAFYAFWKGALSRSEFYTALSRLNLAEQFGREVPSRYVSKHETVNLPVIQGEIRTFRLFEGSGALTGEGEQYVAHIGKNIALYAKGTRIPLLVDRLRRMPANLQVIFEVGNVEEKDIAGDDDLAWAFDQYRRTQTDPLFNYRQSAHGKASFTCPSYGVIHEFISCCASEPAQQPLVQPVMCLGASGSQTECELHEQAWHQVVVYDTRVGSNLVDIHYRRVGAHMGERHDAIFHTLFASVVSRWDRKLCCSILPTWIAGIAAADSRFREPADQLVARLADLNMLDKRDGQFVRRFLSASLRRIPMWQARRYEKQRAFFSPEYRGCLHFLLRFVERLIAERDVCSKFPEPYKSSLPCNGYELKSLIRTFIKRSGGERYFLARLRNREALDDGETEMMKCLYEGRAELDSQGVRALLESHPDEQLREWARRQKVKRWV